MAVAFPTPRLQSAVALAKSVILAVMPSFLSDITNPERRRRPPRLHPTSHLDGLRGLAACAVFAYHYTDYNHKPLLPHYGNNAEQLGGSSVIQLPYVRLLYSGTPMVHLFFVISGFALSFRPLRTLYNSPSPRGGPDSQALAKCHAILASSAFRRPFRLLIPPMTTTLLTNLIIQLGFLNGYRKPKDTLLEQLYDWWDDAFHRIGWAWAWDEGSPKSAYNPHLWTIPMELVHSMFLFLVILTCSRLRSARLRQAVLVLIMSIVLFSGRWAAFEFVGGAFLADLYHYGETLDAPSIDEEKEGLITALPSVILSPDRPMGEFKKYTPVVLRICSYVFLAIAILGSGFILSWPPRDSDMTDTYRWIQSLAPAVIVKDKPERGRNFWLAIAALSTVWASGRLTLSKKILNSGLAQYAGRISFCFYILQHPVLNLLQHNVLGAEGKPASGDKPAVAAWGVRGVTGIQTPFQRTVCWLIGLAIIGSVLVWLADLFTRILDGPAVRFARWLENISFAKDEARDDAALQK
jgi:peptidoglycan/LPS O-acetylase OafA/YrhL